MGRFERKLQVQSEVNRRVDARGDANQPHPFALRTLGAFDHRANRLFLLSTDIGFLRQILEKTHTTSTKRSSA
jgi:hypothetical protein